MCRPHAEEKSIRWLPVCQLGKQNRGEQEGRLWALQVTHLVNKCSSGERLTEAEGAHLKVPWRVIENSRPSPMNPSWVLMWASQIGPDLGLWNGLRAARSLSSWTSLAGVGRSLGDGGFQETSGQVGWSFCWVLHCLSPVGSRGCILFTPGISVPGTTLIHKDENRWSKHENFSQRKTKTETTARRNIRSSSSGLGQNAYIYIALSTFYRCGNSCWEKPPEPPTLRHVLHEAGSPLLF